MADRSAEPWYPTAAYLYVLHLDDLALAASYQAAHARPQATIGIPAIDHGVGTKQPLGGFTQGRTCQTGVECLQGVQLLQRSRRRPWPSRCSGRLFSRTSQLAQFGPEHAMVRARHVARADGEDVGHAILQAWRQRQAQAAARPARGEHQASAVVDQVFLTGDAPQLEADGIRRRVDVRV